MGEILRNARIESTKQWRASSFARRNHPHFEGGCPHPPGGKSEAAILRRAPAGSATLRWFQPLPTVGAGLISAHACPALRAFFHPHPRRPCPARAAGQFHADPAGGVAGGDGLHDAERAGCADFLESHRRGVAAGSDEPALRAGARGGHSDRESGHHDEVHFHAARRLHEQRVRAALHGLSSELPAERLLLSFLQPADQQPDLPASGALHGHGDGGKLSRGDDGAGVHRGAADHAAR